MPQKYLKNKKPTLFSLIRDGLRYFWKDDKKSFIIGTILIVFNSIFYNLGSVLIGLTISLCFPIDVINGTKEFNIPLFSTLCVILAIFFIGFAFFKFYQNKIFSRLAFKTTSKIREEVMNKLLNMPISYYDGEKTGDIISTLINDINNLGKSLDFIFRQLTGSVLNMFFVFVTLMLFSSTITPIVIAISLILFSISFVLLIKARPYYIKLQNNLGDLNGYVEEMLINAKITYSFDRQNTAQDKLKNITNDIYKNSISGIFLSRLLRPWQQIASYLIILTLVALALTFNNHNIPLASVYYKRADAGFIVIFVSLLYSYIDSTDSFFNIAFESQTGVASSKRINKLLSLELPPSIKNVQVLENVKGEIEFKNVWFKYSKKSKQYQLKNASFKVKPGQTTAIVGPTGAGKTTIISLLNKFYDYDKGSILIDGVELKNITKYNLREYVSTVLQDSFVFKDTVLNNIKVAHPSSSLEEVQETAKLLDAHHFIMRMEQGYDTVIDNSSSQLSRGEKQLLNVTRAILGNKKILILDEATSNIDSNTEKIIQNSLQKNFFKDKTSIVIAHRLSTIKNADQILVINNGEIIEKGTHETLIEQKGFYYNMYRAQFD
ncbi:ABC transporter ATP-binding protein [Mycoplasma sp. Mirounga ES2805-ORL]|uniref:ABC transporter ATP-binding protein n=1 Tax=Mycoplasma sp. Mirounga ES2805-ORL TaxID=754514 RepID=UPI00197C482B|nr:ABC transporter ATP-binding protein [Mycoplasma sp. Mirounga ES2805-ORL]QSF13713.1 ABC transporter ATP-binding protein [Mycoplasma sp. Mirounga ES2805-ORL]